MSGPSEPGAGGQGGETRYAGRYRVIHRLGAGGMATVYLAEDERLGRQVAIKRLRAESSEDAAARFRREAQLGASFNHPNLVTVYDIVAEGDAVLIVMEYLPGGDLGRSLKAGNRIPPERALEILRGVASGLDRAHAQGVIHRDVKPSNILLGARGEAKLTDLGVAKVLEDTSATRSGAMPGTPLYMAPEQLRGGRVSEATDIYSLGLTAFQILSGRHARRGSTIAEIAHQVVNEPPPDIRQAWPEAPEAVSKVLCRAMDRQPGRRPRTASQLVEELDAALQGDSVPLLATPTETMTVPPPPPPTEPEHEPEPVPKPEPERRSRRGALLALGALAAVAALVAVLLLGSGGDGGGSSPKRAQAQKAAAGGSDGNGGGNGGNVAVSAPSAGDPAAAVQDFYESAAGGDFATAWADASPNLQALFGSEDGLASEFSTLESIDFTSLQTTSEGADSAEVAFSTVATHTDFVDTCSGTATLVRGTDGWLLDDPGVSCTRSS
jgi:eukaryotic-like serine/threonine-protein kinase